MVSTRYAWFQIALTFSVYCAVVLDGVDLAPVIPTAKVPPPKEMLTFMKRFGYLKDGGSDTEALYTEDAFRHAIKEMQSFGGLAVTGEIDKETLNLLNTPRCGVSDKIDSTNFNGTIRKRRYVIGSKGWRKKRLSYFLANWAQEMDPEETLKLLRKAFRVWSDITPIRFKHVRSMDADIIVSFGRGYHGDSYPFDGKGNILAHAFFPYDQGSYGGDMHFDDDETWVDKSRNNISEGIDFFTVATHEIGHSLGIAHSRVPNSVMFPYYKGYDKQFRVDYDDVLATYNLYVLNNKFEDDIHEEAPTLKPTSPGKRRKTYDEDTVNDPFSDDDESDERRVKPTTDEVIPRKNQPRERTRPPTIPPYNPREVTTSRPVPSGADNGKGYGGTRKPKSSEDRFPNTPSHITSFAITSHPLTPQLRSGKDTSASYDERRTLHTSRPTIPTYVSFSVIRPTQKRIRLITIPTHIPLSRSPITIKPENTTSEKGKHLKGFVAASERPRPRPPEISPNIPPTIPDNESWYSDGTKTEKDVSGFQRSRTTKTIRKLVTIPTYNPFARSSGTLRPDEDNRKRNYGVEATSRSFRVPSTAPNVIHPVLLNNSKSFMFSDDPKLNGDVDVYRKTRTRILIIPTHIPRALSSTTTKQNIPQNPRFRPRYTTTATTTYNSPRVVSNSVAPDDEQLFFEHDAGGKDGVQKPTPPPTIPPYIPPKKRTEQDKRPRVGEGRPQGPKKKDEPELPTRPTHSPKRPVVNRGNDYQPGNTTDVPDICQGPFDSASFIRGELFIFKGPYMWRMQDRGIVVQGYPAPFHHFFTKMPWSVRKIDAIYQRPDDRIVLFSGNQFWVFDGQKLDRESPQPIQSLGLPQNVDHVDAAFVWGKNGKTYLFLDSVYWRYDDNVKKMDVGYPLSIGERWQGLPDRVNTAFTWRDGLTYFFKGPHYWRFNNDAVHIDENYPRFSTIDWIGCQDSK